MLLLITYIGLVFGQFSVKYPKEYLRENITFNIANFGYVPYGQQISGILELAAPKDYCDTSSSPQPGINPYENNSSSYMVKILVVQRGNCTFLQKSVNAQQDGYLMLIIVDDKEENFEQLDLISRNSSVEVDIPAIMISKKDGNDLIANMTAVRNIGKSLKAFVKFPQIEKQDIVEYSYWFSAMDANSYQFIEQFYPFHLQLASQLNFTPHYAMVPCKICQQSDYTIKDHQCLSGGRYCAPDPDGDGPLQGGDAVQQIVKQLCIFQEDKNKWWQYVLKYQQLCLNSTDPISCEKNATQSVGLKYSKIMECFNDSFEGKDIYLNDNKLLRQEYFIHQIYDIFTWPVLIVQQLKYKGSLSLPLYSMNTSTGAQELFDTSHYGPLQMICRAYKDNKMPKLCQERMIGYIVDDRIVQHSPGSSTWYIWLMTIFVMITVMGCAIFLFRRYAKKNNQQIIIDQVNIHLSQYHALQERTQNNQSV